MIKLLNKDIIENIMSSASDILENIGVIFDSTMALDLFKKAGCSIDGLNVKISEKLLQSSLALMPDFVYEPEEKKVLAGAMFGNVPTIYDDDNKVYRRADLNDAIKMYQLCETSDLYDCVNPSTVDPYGITADDLYSAQLAMCLKYSDKYLSNGMRATAQNSKGGDLYTSAKRAIRMVKDFYGVYDEAVMDQNICPMSPLAYDREALENMIAAVEEGQNVGICPCSLTNLTGPPSIFETVVHDVALALAGVVFVQLLSPGKAVSLSDSSGATDMRTIQPTYGTVEATLIQCMFFEFCVYYNIEASICASLCDAPIANYQAGIETYLSTFLPYYYIDLDVAWCYPGHMAAWYCGSFEKAILDEELMRNINRSFAPLNTTLETNFNDILLMAKEKNTFLTGRTPKEYRRDHYLSKIFSKYGVSQDLDIEKTDLSMRVKKEIKTRLDAYQLPERTKDQQKLLNEFLPNECKY